MLTLWLQVDLRRAQAQPILFRSRFRKLPVLYKEIVMNWDATPTRPETWVWLK